MYIVRKESAFNTEFLVVKVTPSSVSYKYSEDENDATKFKSETEAVNTLKKSGFLAHPRVEVVPV
jgi:hypothetical protein